MKYIFLLMIFLIGCTTIAPESQENQMMDDKDSNPDSSEDAMNSDKDDMEDPMKDKEMKDDMNEDMNDNMDNTKDDIDDDNMHSDEMDDMMDDPKEDMMKEPVRPSGWRGISLSDVKTSESFFIGQFEKPVLLETFAVWCPTCKRQQDEVMKLHQSIGDDVISVAIDIDPNEDEDKVRSHVERHGYHWRFSVAPAEFTQSLIDEFGVTVANAPSAPMILVCNGEAELLRSNVKPSETLKKWIEEC